MKTINHIATAVLLAAALFLPSCKKNEAPTQEFSSKITSIITTAELDTLKARGMNINGGFTPPKIEGIYEASPFTLQCPYGPEDGYYVGQEISAYDYRFFDQIGDDIKLDYKQVTDVGNGQGAFLSGSGNSFSMFIKTEGQSYGLDYTQVAVISGTITPQGIRNFQYAFVLTSKTGDDDNYVMMPVGKSRIWKDSDDMASSITTF